MPQEMMGLWSWWNRGRDLEMVTGGSVSGMVKTNNQDEGRGRERLPKEGLRRLMSHLVKGEVARQ